MLLTTLQSLMAHRFRLFSTALAITLGVAFTAGTLILTDTISRTFNQLVGDIYQDTDVVVRGVEQFDGPMNMGIQRPRVDADLVEVVDGVDGVAVAEGSVMGYARIVGKDGQPLGDPSNGPPALGFTWSDDERLNPLVLKDGRAPHREDEVVIDVLSADKGDISVGDRATVLVQTGPEQVRVVGTVRFGTADTIGGATMVGFIPSTAQRLLGEPGKYDEIAVVAERGVDDQALVSGISAVLPDATEAVSGAAVTKENQDSIGESMGVFTQFMQFFAVVALLVGAFMIFNTFSITVAQRTRENGLLRALGASRRQVLMSVLVEALTVGIFASVLGLAAGLGIATALEALLDALGFGIPTGGLVFGMRTVFVALTAGVVVTVVAAASPARQAAKVPPVAAMQSHAVGSSGYGSKRRMLVGAGVLTSGAAALLLGLFGELDNPQPVVALGTLGVFLGVAVLGRTIALPLSRVLGAPLIRTRGLAGELARENAMRNPKRTAAAASALMIGVGVVGIIMIFVASIKGTVDEGIDRAFTSDLVVDSGASVVGGLDPALADRLDALPEVESATGLRVTPAIVAGDVLLLGALDPQRAFDMLQLKPLSGEAAALDEDGIAVFEKTAEEKGLALGDSVQVTFKETGDQELTVALIYGEELEANGPDGTFFIGHAAFAANVPQNVDWQIYVTRSPTTSGAETRAAVDGVLATYAGVEVMDKAEFAEVVSAPLDPMLALVYALLGLAVFIALLGIANTLGLSIVERTRELGLLRAVGMTRRQLRSAIRWESVIISVQGTLLGLLIALFVGWALVSALADQGIDVFRVPTGSLLVVVLLGAFAGMIAAILPARRAARLDVLRAVSSQ